MLFCVCYRDRLYHRVWRRRLFHHIQFVLYKLASSLLRVSDVPNPFKMVGSWHCAFIWQCSSNPYRSLVSLAALITHFLISWSYPDYLPGMEIGTKLPIAKSTSWRECSRRVMSRCRFCLVTSPHLERFKKSIGLSKILNWDQKRQCLAHAALMIRESSWQKRSRTGCSKLFCLVFISDQRQNGLATTTLRLWLMKASPWSVRTLARGILGSVKKVRIDRRPADLLNPLLPTNSFFFSSSLLQCQGEMVPVTLLHTPIVHQWSACQKNSGLQSKLWAVCFQNYYHRSL